MGRLPGAKHSTYRFIVSLSLPSIGEWTTEVLFASMSSDGSYNSNANLALKGITGLYAMGKINQILEARGADPSKTSHYLVGYTSWPVLFVFLWT